MENKIKEQLYYVKGMHCLSCEILIEKKLMEWKNVKSAEASTAKGEVLIEYEGRKPSAEEIARLFQKAKYVFSDSPFKIENKTKAKDILTVVGVGIAIILVFIGLNKLGFSNLINVNANSSLVMFLLFGIIAGLSSCAALVGGIILSLAKQWGELHPAENSTWKKFQPHFLFNAGRLVSYGVLGAVLGSIGNKLNLSLKIGPVFVIIISAIMILLALQMFGLKMFKRFQFSAPKFITRYVADESHFKGRYMPFIMGALTFFLPCGFTITAQGLALISGSAWHGGLIMLFFALGTLPMLLIIGLSSVKFAAKAELSNKFYKIAGIIILLLAFFNINSQLNVIGAFSLNNLAAKNQIQANDGFAPIVNGVQIMKMNASASGYSPNFFKVKADIPVRWEITDTGTSGCTNAVVSRGLFSGEIPLAPGRISIKEFTPSSAGRYKFSCWMGMISGVIDVVDDRGQAPEQSNALNSNQFAASGAENAGGSCNVNGRCGCGGR